MAHIMLSEDFYWWIHLDNYSSRRSIFSLSHTQMFAQMNGTYRGFVGATRETLALVTGSEPKAPSV